MTALSGTRSNFINKLEEIGLSNSDGFSMKVINLEEVGEDVGKEIEALPEETRKLKEQAAVNALAVINCDVDSMESKKNILVSIEQFGVDTLQKSSSKNKMLGTTLGQLSQSGSESGQVLQSLVDLQREVTGLDPSAVDFLKKGFLGKLFNPVANYFKRFEKAESAIADIIQSLENGKTKLKNDNTTLQLEQKELTELSARLKMEIDLATFMDEFIEDKLRGMESGYGDPEKIRFVKEEVLFPLRKHTMNMQKMSAVNQQSIIAMAIIRQNNSELIAGVSEAVTVTVSALRTAVMVAQALYDQRIVLQKIKAVGETTDNIIVGTSKMLKDQSMEIHEEMTKGGVTVDALKEAFTNIFETVEIVGEYKQKALPILKQQIEQFKELADKGEAEVKKLEGGSLV